MQAGSNNIYGLNRQVLDFNILGRGLHNSLGFNNIFDLDGEIRTNWATFYYKQFYFS